MDPHLVVRARGALLGLVVGNQLGVPTEGKDAQAIREAFPQGVRDLAPPPKGSPFDDDAAMTLLLADSLAEKGDFDAEDVAQTVFVRAFRELPRFRGESAVKTWLYRIAVNESLGALRRRRDATEPLWTFT